MLARERSLLPIAERCVRARSDTHHTRRRHEGSRLARIFSSLRTHTNRARARAHVNCFIDERRRLLRVFGVAFFVFGRLRHSGRTASHACSQASTRPPFATIVGVRLPIDDKQRKQTPSEEALKFVQPLLRLEPSQSRILDCI